MSFRFSTKIPGKKIDSKDYENQSRIIPDERFFVVDLKHCKYWILLTFGVSLIHSVLQDCLCLGILTSVEDHLRKLFLMFPLWRDNSQSLAAKHPTTIRQSVAVFVVAVGWRDATFSAVTGLTSLIRSTDYRPWVGNKRRFLTHLTRGAMLYKRFMGSYSELFKNRRYPSTKARIRSGHNLMCIKNSRLMQHCFL